MALATNSTPGSIVLAGDLTGVATSPSLRVTGVTPGSFHPANIIVDNKGRIIWAKQADWENDIKPIIDDASYSNKGVVQVFATTDTCNPQLTLSAGVLTLNMQDASDTVKGKITVDALNSYLEILNDGILKVKYSTITSKGIMQAGTNLTATGGVISVADATTSVKGTVQVGSGMSVSSGVLSIADATTGSKGIVQVGSGLQVSSGTISIADATDSSKGLVQIGSGLQVTGGVVSLNAPDATTGVKGIVQVGSGLQVTGGVLSVQEATVAAKGIMQVGSGLSVSAGVVSVDTSAMRLNATNTTTHAQSKTSDVLSGASVSWNGTESNIFTITPTGNFTLNNGTSVVGGATYNFIIYGTAVITYGTMFKFKPGCVQQPTGTSVLTCFATDASTLVCMMQPNFV